MSWKENAETMKMLIAAASIARQAHDKLDSGAGAPDQSDMRRYAEEAEAIADLWAEVAQ